MSDFRLKTKVEIDTQKSQERKKEVDEGMKLAKSVDLLRETYAQEQTKLRLFRESTLKVIKDDMNALELQKNSMVEVIRALEARKRDAEAPIDLTKEWKKLEIDKKEIENIKIELSDRETHVMNREIVAMGLSKREEEIKEKEKQAQSYLAEATRSYEKTEILRSEMESRKLESEKEIESRYSILTGKEQDMISREYKVNKEKESIEKRNKELLETGSKLIERESTVQSKTKELFEREEKVKEMEALTRQYNQEASINYDKSSEILAQTKTKRDEFDREVSNKEESLREKEQSLGYRERDLILLKESLERERQEIEKEKIHISSQQKTLKVAWENIKRLQQ